MRRLAHAKRRDKNELEIVRALQQIGCSVVRMDDPADLLVGYRGRTFLIEVKTPRGVLTDDQLDFIATWNGDPMYVVRTVDEAITRVTA